MEEKKGGWIITIALVCFVLIFVASSAVFFYLIQEEKQFNASDNLFIEETNELNNLLNNEKTYPEGMFYYENMRFPDRKITYSISQECSPEKVDDTKKAFEILSDKTILTFEENTNGQIIARCSEESQKINEEYYVVGEGGPNTIIDTGKFYLVANGTIILTYEKNECEEPLVAIHEILHVLGLRHSSDQKSIMYNFSSCSQKISEDIIGNLSELYNTLSLPDMVFTNVSAAKKGFYMDAEFIVTNIGLKEAGNVSISIYSGDTEIGVYYVGKIRAGEGRLVKLKNFKVPYSLSAVVFNIDYNNSIAEINEYNNKVELTLK